eukprot:TRINITY_DN43109_c0_g1_i1.p1 TRINITY_DN43109_c0_g1~~TRINITY_DN43109_c0_g1_i1.p1  ORF type:complete len:116 (-),score=13.41 TRINITY_DN43109_c0_g1_i1:62-409(-)
MPPLLPLSTSIKGGCVCKNVRSRSLLPNSAKQLQGFPPAFASTKCAKHAGALCQLKFLLDLHRCLKQCFTSEPRSLKLAPKTVVAKCALVRSDEASWRLAYVVHIQSRKARQQPA